MSAGRIVGPDGRPIGAGPTQPVQLTPGQFCSGVIGAYLSEMSKNKIDPLSALVEMGSQIPSVMVQLVQQETNGLVSPAEEPLKLLLQNIAAVCRQYGFRILFRMEFAGQEDNNPNTTTEPKGENDGSTSGTDRENNGRQPEQLPTEIQRSSDQENSDSPNRTGPTCGVIEPEV